jgi:hypothetical protein
MEPTLHILYISGLGDGYDRMRRTLLKMWRYRNVTTELVSMTWADGKPYEEKFDKLSKAIDASAGKRIVLIGESAGGSMAVNMYAARANDLYKVMTICGKNTSTHGVSPLYYAKNPAFKTSMEMTEKSVQSLSEQQRRNFVSITPLADPTVPVKDTLLPGCRHEVVFAYGHFIPISLMLSIYSWIVIRIARK